MIETEIIAITNLTYLTELGTAQPQLVHIFLMIYYLLSFGRKGKVWMRNWINLK